MSTKVLEYIASLQGPGILEPNPYAEKNPISFWKYEMYTQCPKKYQETIINRKKGVSDFRNALEGSVLHATMESFIKIGNWDWSWPMAHFDAMYNGVISDPKITKLTWKGKTPQAQAADKVKSYECAKQMVQWSTDFLREINIKDNPEVHPELYYKARLLPDLYLSGRIDLWTKRKDGMVDIYDWKGVSDITRPKRAQLMHYGLGVLLSTGYEVNSASFVCPQLRDIVGYPLTDESLIQFIQNVIGVHDQIKADTASGKFRLERQHMCKYCPFDEECKKSLVVREVPPEGRVSFG